MRLINGDCLEEIKKMEDNSVTSIVTDPPYGLKFMGKKWDYDVPSVEVWKECLRVLKPGGTLLCFAGTRTQHRMAINIEDAGFTLKDTLMYLFGNGFPKAADISKNIDKKLGKEREVIGVREHPTLKNKDKTLEAATASQGNNIWKREWDITAPATELSAKWEGYKSHGLKPAYEPILWCQKPLSNSTKIYCRTLEALLWLNLERLEKMDTFSLKLMENFALSIDTLWRNCLDESSKQENRFITLTETDKIILLEIYNFLIYENTHLLDILERTYQRGFRLSAIIVEETLKKEKKSMKGILNHTVVESVMSKLKENGTFVNIAEDYLQQITLNAFTVLRNVITNPEKKLYPNNEPIILAIKPNEGSYADNAIKHGVSGLNIDESRVETKDKLGGGALNSDNAVYKVDGFDRPWMHDKDSLERHKDTVRKNIKKAESLGRYPANITHDGSEQVVSCFPNTKSGNGKSNTYEKDGGYTSYEGSGKQIRNEDYGDSGSAARYFKSCPILDEDIEIQRIFYTAKASKKERNTGMNNEEVNNHPTVKPLKLMEYLVGLIKMPENTVVLDPFMGSGTTGIACNHKGVDFIGIELEPEYFKIAEARINNG